MLQKHMGNKEREHAQGMVEFALILPILLLVILGIIEFGRLLFFYSSITSASREAARYGSAVGEVTAGVDRYQDCTGMRDAARRAGMFAGLEDGDITIQYDDGTNLIDASCPPSADIDLADRVVVTVSKNFTPLVPLINVPPIPITSTTARTIIKEVGVRGTPVPTDPLPGVNTPTFTNTPEIPNTPTDTATATATDTATATATATSTGTLVPTATRTPGPTATPTFTNTPTNTPVPICGLEFRNFQQPSDRKITWDLYNNPNPGVLDVTILSFSLSFPTSKLNQIDFGGVTIWNGPPAGSTATINPTDWDGTANDRLVRVGETKTFTLYFNNDMPSSGYTILVVTDNCLDPVSGSR